MTPRQWSRTAWAMAALLASLPVAGRILLGSWGFQEAMGLACLCGLAGVYFHIVSRRRSKVPDPASQLDEAILLANSGRLDEAITMLTEAIRLSPKLWQAFQYRGMVYLSRGATELALDDFNQAIRLAPNEDELYALQAAAIAPPQLPGPDVPVPPTADR